MFRKDIIKSGSQGAAFDEDSPAFPSAIIGEIDLCLVTSPSELLTEPSYHRTRKPFDRSILSLEIAETLVVRSLAVIPNGNTSELTINADEAKKVHLCLSKPERTSFWLVLLYAVSGLNLDKMRKICEKDPPSNTREPVGIIYHLTSPYRTRGRRHKSHCGPKSKRGEPGIEFHKFCFHGSILYSPRRLRAGTMIYPHSMLDFC